jgi:hypothetical protein
MWLDFEVEQMPIELGRRLLERARGAIIKNQFSFELGTKLLLREEAKHC